jgi:hypothetical protein
MKYCFVVSDGFFKAKIRQNELLNFCIRWFFTKLKLGLMKYCIFFVSYGFILYTMFTLRDFIRNAHGSEGNIEVIYRWQG